MTEESRTPEPVSPEEVETQEGEQLPAREAMSILPVGDGFADIPVGDDWPAEASDGEDKTPQRM